MGLLLPPLGLSRGLDLGSKAEWVAVVPSPHPSLPC